MTVLTAFIIQRLFCNTLVRVIHSVVYVQYTRMRKPSVLFIYNGYVIGETCLTCAALMVRRTYIYLFIRYSFFQKTLSLMVRCLLCFDKVIVRKPIQQMKHQKYTHKKNLSSNR